MMKLEPCPMCGGVAFITTGNIVELWQQKVMCCECGLNIVRGGASPSHARERAVEAWNRREPIDKIVEQLEERKQKEGNVTLTKIAHNAAIDDAIEIVKGGYEEVYREEYDTAGNYHAYGTQSGHCVVMKPVIK